MKLKPNHIPYVANKIAIDIANSTLLALHQPLERVSKIAHEILVQDLAVEAAIDEKVRKIMDEKSEDIEFMRLDEKQLFWMIKKQIASEMNFSLLWEDRYNELSHKMLNELITQEIIGIKVRENQIKNLIFRAIDLYAQAYSEIEDTVIEKLKNFKRKIIVGTDEYELIFDKMYQEELKKRGF